MSDQGNRSWNDLVEALGKAAEDIRATLAKRSAESADGEAAASRLKADMSRLEEAATTLRATFAESVEEQRAGLKESFDRDRAEASAGQLKSSLEELLRLAGSVAVDLGAAAGSTFEKARPEILSAASALEGVAKSATLWVRAILDPGARHRRDSSPGDSQPLDTL